jgi:hypothetical protein
MAMGNTSPKQTSGIRQRGRLRLLGLDGVEILGALAVSAMVLFYALESHGAHFVLLFAGACAASSVYAILILAWPFAVVEAIWSLIAIHRWRHWGR